MPSKAIHHETVGDDEIMHEVSVAYQDAVFFRGYDCITKRWKKTHHQFGFLSWDTWAQEGDSLTFEILTFDDAGTLLSLRPFSGESSAGYKREGGSGLLNEGVAIARVQMRYFFQDKQFQVDSDPKFLTTGVQIAGALFLILAIVLIVVLIVTFF